MDKHYEDLLRASVLRGEAEKRRETNERRKHPRIHVDAADIQVDTDSWIFVINLSISGIAFYSNSEFTLGQEVTISTDPEHAVQGRVIEVQAEGGDATALVGQYRVCCEFSDAEAGTAFLLHIKQTEEGRLSEHLDL